MPDVTFDLLFKYLLPNLKYEHMDFQNSKTRRKSVFWRKEVKRILSKEFHLRSALYANSRYDKCTS